MLKTSASPARKSISNNDSYLRIQVTDPAALPALCFYDYLLQILPHIPINRTVAE